MHVPSTTSTHCNCTNSMPWQLGHSCLFYRPLGTAGRNCHASTQRQVFKTCILCSWTDRGDALARRAPVAQRLTRVAAPPPPPPPPRLHTCRPTACHHHLRSRLPGCLTTCLYLTACTTRTHYLSNTHHTTFRHTLPAHTPLPTHLRGTADALVYRDGLLRWLCTTTDRAC